MRVLTYFVAGIAAFALLALALAMALRLEWAAAAILAGFAALCVPALGGLITRATGLPFPPLARGGAALILAGLFVWWLTGPPPATIYRGPGTEAAFDRLYAQYLAAWPVTPESHYLDTRLGRVHVLVAGPESAPPVLLLHPASLASWSWGPNVAALAAERRLYAIDTLGDPGRSAYTDLGARARSPSDLADHYAEVMDRLGLESAALVGASEGGFVALALARAHPGRVERLALIAPMGLGSPLSVAVRLGLAQYFPLGPIPAAAYGWAYSEDPRLWADHGAWFTLTLKRTSPAKVPPWPLSATARRALSQPVLILLGTADNVLGDPEAIRALAADFPNARVEVLEAGHLIAAERPEAVGALLAAFLVEP